MPYGDLTLALSLDGSREGVSHRRLLNFAGELGIPKRASENALEQLLVRTAPVLGDLGVLGLPYDGQTMARWQRELDYRRRQLSS